MPLVSVKPNGLYGFVEWMETVSSRLPLPASGPTNSGSGAAWLADLRSTKLARARKRTLSVMSWVSVPNRLIRSSGVRM